MALDMKGLFVNPATLRQDRLDQLSARRAQLGTMGGSMAGLLGQVAGGGSILGEQLAEGIAGGLGLKTKQEKQAETVQAAMQGIKYDDPASMLQVAKKLEATNPAAADQLKQSAAALKTQQASAAAAARQQAVTNAFEERRILADEQRVLIERAAELRKQGKSEAEIAQIEKQIENLGSQIARRDALLGLEIQEKQAGIAKTVADTKATQVATRFDEQTFQQRVDQVGADLQSTYTQLGLTSAQTADVLAGIKRDDAMHLVDIDKALLEQEVQRFELENKRKMAPHELTELITGNKLLDLNVQRENAEIAKTIAETAEIGKADLGEFERMMARSNLTDAEKEALRVKRLKQMARGGDQGFDPDQPIQEAVINSVIEKTEQIGDFERSARLYGDMYSAAQQANIGAEAPIMDAMTWMAARFGVDSAVETEAANELFDLLYQGGVLENAKHLKGAMSDKDLQFLKDSLAKRGNNPQALFGALAALEAANTAQAEAARAMETALVNGELTGENKVAVGTLTADLTTLAKNKAYIVKAQSDPTLRTGANQAAYEEALDEYAATYAKTVDNPALRSIAVNNTSFYDASIFGGN